MEKQKTKKRNVQTIPKSNRKVVERTQIHDRSLCWFGTST